MIARVLLMVRKDLLRKRYSPLGILVVLSFPLIFSVIVGVVFGGGQPRMPEIELLLEDHDADPLLPGLLRSIAATERFAGRFKIRDVGDEGRALIEANRADALLRIPQGFAARVAAGGPAELELLRNPSRGITPQIVEQTLTTLIDSYSTTSAQAPAPPLIRLETVTVSNDSDTPPPSRRSVFLFVLPGVAVWALFMVGDHGMRDILVEATAGTLRRQLAGPVSARELVLAKALLTSVLATISLLILATCGWMASDRPVALVGFAALSGALIVAVTGFSALVYGLARTERQGATFSSAILLGCAFLGGAFLPLDSLPLSVRSFAPLSPIYWGTSGYQALLHHGAGVSDILRHVSVLAGIGTTLLWIGSSLLHRSMLAGRMP